MNAGNSRTLIYGAFFHICRLVPSNYITSYKKHLRVSLMGGLWAADDPFLLQEKPVATEPVSGTGTAVTLGGRLYTACSPAATVV